MALCKTLENETTQQVFSKICLICVPETSWFETVCKFEKFSLQVQCYKVENRYSPRPSCLIRSPQCQRILESRPHLSMGLMGSLKDRYHLGSVANELVIWNVIGISLNFAQISKKKNPIFKAPRSNISLSKRVSNHFTQNFSLIFQQKIIFAFAKNFNENLLLIKQWMGILITHFPLNFPSQESLVVFWEIPHSFDSHFQLCGSFFNGKLNWFCSGDYWFNGNCDLFRFGYEHSREFKRISFKIYLL